MEEIQECICCKIVKPLSEFYVHPQMGNGHLGKCKECIKAYQHIHYRETIVKHALYERDRSKKKSRRAKALDYQRKRRANRPDRDAAYRKVRYAIMSGNLERKPCEKCGDVNTEAHHDDYSRPLDVRWLCYGCHLLVHGKQKINIVSENTLISCEDGLE